MLNKVGPKIGLNKHLGSILVYLISGLTVQVVINNFAVYFGVYGRRQPFRKATTLLDVGFSLGSSGLMEAGGINDVKWAQLQRCCHKTALCREVASLKAPSVSSIFGYYPKCCSCRARHEQESGWQPFTEDACSCLLLLPILLPQMYKPQEQNRREDYPPERIRGETN